MEIGAKRPQPCLHGRTEEGFWLDGRAHPEPGPRKDPKPAADMPRRSRRPDGGRLGSLGRGRRIRASLHRRTAPCAQVKISYGNETDRKTEECKLVVEATVHITTLGNWIILVNPNPLEIVSLV